MNVALYIFVTLNLPNMNKIAYSQWPLKKLPTVYVQV